MLAEGERLWGRYFRMMNASRAPVLAAGDGGETRTEAPGVDAELQESRVADLGREIASVRTEQGRLEARTGALEAG